MFSDEAACCKEISAYVASEVSSGLHMPIHDSCKTKMVSLNQKTFT